MDALSIGSYLPYDAVLYAQNQFCSVYGTVDTTYIVFGETMLKIPCEYEKFASSLNLLRLNDLSAVMRRQSAHLRLGPVYIDEPGHPDGLDYRGSFQAGMVRGAFYTIPRQSDRFRADPWTSVR